MVETVFGRRDFDENIPLKQIAEEAGVSEAMVVKITKKLGFTGYRDFRTAVYEYNRLPTAEMHQELSVDDSSGEIVQKVFRTSIQALEETLAILDIEAFDRAADLLYRAAKRDFYGVGGSAQIARDVAHKFLRIGVRAIVYDDSHMMLMSASLLGARRHRDRLLAFRQHDGRDRRHPARSEERRADDRHHQLRRLAAGPDRRRRSVFDRARLAADGRECRGAHRPAQHPRRAVRGRRATRLPGGGEKSREDDVRRDIQTKGPAHEHTPSSSSSAACTTTSWSKAPPAHARVRR